MNNIIRVICISFVVAGCEKVVDIKYKSNQSEIVIEGNITNEPGPYFVKVTKSIDLANTGSYPAIDNAMITISDDSGNNDILTPVGNGSYRTNTITGAEGKTYKLTVHAEGQTFVAESTMPQQSPFDSIKIQADIITGETEYSLIPVYTDPSTKGDNYRFVLWLNNKLVNQHLVQNDEIKNGVTNTVRLEINDNDLAFKPGDSVAIQMQCIDKNVALYYTTLALMGDSGPGGGTTPNNPPGNISNGALGIFSAHTVNAKSALLP